jgi:uncharacterized protein
VHTNPIPASTDAATLQRQLSQEMGIPSPSPSTAGAAVRVGTVFEIADGEARFLMDHRQLGSRDAASDAVSRNAGHVGSYVKIMVEDLWVFGSVRALRGVSELSRVDQENALIGEIEFVGETPVEPDNNGFRRGITRYPAPGDAVMTVTSSDLADVFAPRGRAHVSLGTVYPTDDVRAALFIDALLGKHFALLGSTGTGKSTTAALLLHRIIERLPNAHVMMLDPHGEYSAAFKDRAEQFDVNNLELPYWLMTFDEHVEVFIGRRTPDTEVEIDILARCLLAARQKSRLAADIGRVTVDTPIPYPMSELTNHLQTQMGRLDKPDKIGPYLKLKSRIEEVKADPRYSFMFSGLLVNDSFSPFLQRLLRMPGKGKPVSVIDLSGVPSEIVNVVVAVIARLIFDFALWSDPQTRRPVLLICEEAHRYVPAERLDAWGSARKVMERIAKEGRKYGVSLGLVTQRPSDLSESILSQCGTIMSLRMNNEKDQAIVRSTVPEGARSLLDALPSLRNRECFVSGEGVPLPIRVRLDDVAPDLRPASADPLFSQEWRDPVTSTQAIDDTIRRWRLQSR